jgi:site-specific DNA recombinase
MDELKSKQDNAVAAIRVSSVKQGLQGDSPDAQKEQIEQFAKAHNIHIKKFFIFMESASKEEQPVQEAIDYCKNPKNDIQLFVIKSIDRFTRGGSYLYDHLKMQLTHYKVKLVDIYGIIGTQEVNTLEHLGVKFDWSVYSPTKKSEILEAERAKDEMRDIMSRMIGAEIRYVRLGYRVRIPPYGYKNEKTETVHGRRNILIPHPDESPFIIKMYELRIRGSLGDEQIVKEINSIGYKSRIRLIRNPKDRTKILGKKGGRKLTVKQLHKYIRNPLYAAINQEKWTQGEAIKCKFDGLVSIDTFNKANRGKIIIVEEDGKVKIYKDKPVDWRLKKNVKNQEYPYKKYVLCPKCRSYLLGSASKGRWGNYYPAYHCSNHGHYFRVPVKKFEDTVVNFVKQLNITNHGIQEFKKAVLVEWNKRITSNKKDTSEIDNKMLELKAQSKLITDKLPYLSSLIAIKALEEQLESIQMEIAKLEQSRKEKDQDSISMEMVLELAVYYMEHLEELIFSGSDSLRNVQLFSVLFTTPPTYEELTDGTPQLEPFINLTRTLSDPKSVCARPKGVEPPTASSEAMCSIH